MDVLTCAKLRPRAKSIVAEVAERHGVSVSDIRGPRRLAHFVRARREAALRMRVELGISTIEIGKHLRRDHSTVLNLLGLRSRTARVGVASGGRRDFGGLPTIQHEARA